AVLLKVGELVLFSCKSTFELRNLAVLDFRSTCEIAGVACLVQLEFQVLQFYLSSTHMLDGFLLGLPLCFHARGRFLEISNSLFDLLQAYSGSFVLFALQGLTLNFQLNNFALQLIDLLRKRINLDA